MPFLKRKFGGGYNPVFDDGHYNRKRSPERMIFGGQPNITKALLSLGIQAQQMLDQDMDYRRPPKMMKYDTGSSYRGGRQTYRGKKPTTKKSVDKGKQPLYRCLFCSDLTKNKKGHLEHLKTKKHIDRVSERQTLLTDKLRKLVLKVQEDALETQKKYSRSTLKFCHVCCVNYHGPQSQHESNSLHQEYQFMTELECADCGVVLNSRFQFEKHLLTLDHIRNRHYQRLTKEYYVVPKEMLEVEDYDPKEVTGYEFIGNVRGYYCQVCDEVFLHKDMSPLKHSQSEKHYEKFKEYAQKKLAEIGQENQEEADQDTEDASPTKEESTTEAKDEDEHMEDDNIEADEDGENPDEDGGDVDDEEAEDVEDEEAENVEDEEVENADEDVENADEEVENADEEVENADEEMENADEDVENVDDEEAENVDEEAENADEDAENVDEDAENVDEEAEDADEEVENADEEAEDVENEAVNEEAEDEEEDFEDAQEELTSPQKGKSSPKKAASAASRPRRSLRSK